MATNDKLTTVSTNDFFGDDYFNDILKQFKTMIMNNPLNLSNNAPVRGMRGVSYFSDFSADVSQTSTNLTHRDYGRSQELVGKATDAITYESEQLVMPSNCTTALVNLHYDIFTQIDECDDSSLSAANWPTSTGGSEGANGITWNGASAQITSKDLSGSEIIVIKYMIESSAVSGETSTFQITDTSSTTTVQSTGGTSGGGSSSDGKVEGTTTFFLDWSGKKVYWINDVFIESGHDGAAGSPTLDQNSVTRTWGQDDLSGWSQFSVEFVTSASGTGNGQIYWLRELLLAPSTADPTVSFSADGGSNYTALDSNGIIVRAGDAGTQPQIKATTTLAAGEVIGISGFSLNILS